MARKIELELRVKNALARGLKSAGAALEKFGQSAKRIGAFFTKAFIGAGAAVAGFAVKALHAFGVQEAAERSMASALRTHGEEIDANMAAIKRMASAIQDETGVADENVIARMARLRMLGVETDQLDAAAKATIALKSAGMEEAAAIKAVAMATQGNYEMLGRYIGALRNTTDEAEKARIVNDFLTKGYAQQKDQLDTVAGQWGLLKGRISDAWEKIGEAIAQNDALMDVLKRAGEAVKRFGERVKEWAGRGGMAELMATAQHFFEILRHGWNMTSNTAHVAFAAIADGAETSARFVVEAFKTIGRVAVATWEAIKKPSRDSFRNIAAAAKSMADNVEVVSRRTEAALAEREKMQTEHAGRVEKINAAHTAKLVGQAEEGAEKEAKAIEQIAIARRNVAKEAEALEKKIADERKRIAQENVEAIKKQIAAQEELARQTIDAFLAEKRAGEDAARREEDERQRAERLAKVEAQRGRKMSREDREWLDAFRAIEDAKGAVAPGMGLQKQLADAQAALDLQVGQKKTLDDMLAELQLIQADLTKNLQAAGV
jgi:hypothetical protein